MRNISRRCAAAGVALVGAAALSAVSATAQKPAAAATAAALKPRFEVSFPPTAISTPVTGRVFVMISRVNDRELLFERGIVDPVIKTATPQRIRQVARTIRRQHHVRPVRCLDRSDFGNRHLKIRKHFEQKSFKLLVTAIDLVDQQHVALAGGEDAAERAELDVAADIGDVAGAEAAVVEALHRVVHVQPVGGLGGRLDVPGQHGHLQSLGDVSGQHRLAGPRLALDHSGRSRAMAQLTASTSALEAM